MKSIFFPRVVVRIFPYGFFRTDFSVRTDFPVRIFRTDFGGGRGVWGGDVGGWVVGCPYGFSVRIFRTDFPYGCRGGVISQFLNPIS